MIKLDALASFFLIVTLSSVVLTFASINYFKEKKVSQNKTPQAELANASFGELSAQLGTFENLTVSNNTNLNGDIFIKGEKLDIAQLISESLNISNGVTSLQDETGDLKLTAGNGITIDGLTITNNAPNAIQNTFEFIQVNNNEIDTTFGASKSNDTLTFVAGGNINIASDTTNKKVTISSTATGWQLSGSNVYLSDLTYNVGIGTSTPTGKLHISGDVNAGDSTSSVGLTIGNQTQDQGIVRLLYTNAAASGSPMATLSFQPRDNADTSNIDLANIDLYKTAGADTGFITFRTRNATSKIERMRIDPDGNVGIGTSTPAHRLSVGSDTAAASSGSITIKQASSADGFLSQASSNDDFLRLYHTGSAATLESTYQSTGSYTPISFRTSATEVGSFSAAGQFAVPVTGSSAGILIGGDTQLYRSAANQLALATGDNLILTGSSSGDTLIQGQVSGDSATRFLVDTNGALFWGPGNASRDVSLSRGAANRLDLASGDSFYVTSGTLSIGDAPDSTVALQIDRTVSTATGFNQLYVDGALTVTGGTSNQFNGYFANNGGITINSAGTHDIVGSVALLEPNITETSGSVTNAVTLYINDAPTEGSNNYAFWVDGGKTRLDGRTIIGTGGNDPSAAQVLLSYGEDIDSSLSGTTRYGLLTRPVFPSSLTNTAVGISSAVQTSAAAYTLSAGMSFRAANAQIGAASTLTSQYGLYIDDQTSGGSDYGIAIEGADTQALWISSAADNTDAANGIAFGASRDTQLYRGSADRLDLASGDSLNIVSGSLQVAGSQIVSSSGTLSVPGAYATIGSTDSNNGILEVFGDGAGSNNGSLVRFHTSADHDAVFDYFSLNVYNDDFNIGVGEAFTALTITNDGQIQAPVTGSSAGLLIGGDTNLYRSAADTLVTDDDFRIGNTTSNTVGLLLDSKAATTTQVLRTSVQGDGAARLTITAGGTLAWGDGTSAVDTNLYRLGTNSLATDDSFQIRGGTLNLGVADTTGGTFNIHGPASGNTGAFVRLYMSGDYDATDEHWTNWIYQDDMYWSLATTGSMMRLDNTGRLNVLTTGSGAGIVIGSDTHLYRGDTNRLDLASGDSLYVVNGGGGAIGIGAAPNAGYGVYVSNDFSYGSGEIHGLKVGEMTLTQTSAGGSSVQTASFGINSSVVINSGVVHSLVSNAYFSMPSITETSGSVTNAANVYIEGAPTAATNNYALWVDSGAVQFDAALTVGTGITATTGNIQATTGKFITDASGQTVGLELNGYVDAGSFNNYILNNSPNAGTYATLNFGRGTGTLFGFIRSNNNSQAIELGTAGTVRLAIDTNGQVALSTTGSTGGLLIGGDTQLYRSAADVLTTPDNLDVEGYASIGNAEALNDSYTLSIARTASVTDGSEATAQLNIAGTLTAGGANQANQFGAWIHPSITINNGGSNTVVASVGIQEPNITETSGAVSNAVSLYVQGAPTEGAENYAFWVDSGAVRLDGTVEIGAPSTANTTALCWDNSGNSIIYDCNGSATDLAELYGTEDASIEAADIVVSTGEAQEILDPSEGKHTSRAFIAKSSTPYQSSVLGVISTNPNQVYGEDGVFTESDNPRPVSLAGRVPVKVSTENGPIHTGDAITSSSIPGVGMKATKAGRIVGTALQSYNGEGVGSVIVFVNPSYFLGTALAQSVSDDPLFSLLDSVGTLNTQYQGQILSSDQVQKLIGEQATVLGISTEQTSSVSAQLASLTQDFSLLEESLNSQQEAIASISATLANLPIINLAQLATGSAVLGITIVEEDFAVSGNTTLANLSTIGNITVANNLTLASASINTIGEDLQIQPLKQGNVSFMDGLVTIDTTGNVVVAGKISVETLETDQIIITTTPTNRKIGVATLSAGQTFVTIDTTALTSDSKILLTPKTTTYNQVLFVSDTQIGESFIVNIDEAQTTDIEFNWFILDSKEEVQP